MKIKLKIVSYIFSYESKPFRLQQAYPHTLHGVVLNQLSTGTTLPFFFTKLLRSREVVTANKPLRVQSRSHLTNQFLWEWICSTLLPSMLWLFKCSLLLRFPNSNRTSMPVYPCMLHVSPLLSLIESFEERRSLKFGSYLQENTPHPVG
jgi:hypothetical protein